MNSDRSKEAEFGFILQFFVYSVSYGYGNAVDIVQVFAAPIRKGKYFVQTEAAKADWHSAIAWS